MLGSTVEILLSPCFMLNGKPAQLSDKTGLPPESEC